jgi:hypothetical protein
MDVWAVFTLGTRAISESEAMFLWSAFGLSRRSLSGLPSVCATFAPPVEWHEGQLWDGRVLDSIIPTFVATLAKLQGQRGRWKGPHGVYLRQESEAPFIRFSLLL